VLDHPQTRNALSDAMLDDLIEAFTHAKTDPEARVVVLTSSHRSVFSAGGDLKNFASDSNAIAKYANLDRYPRLCTLIGGLGKPVLCAANGHVLAGSLGLALSCDLVVAKESVRFGCPEINVGLFPFMVSALLGRNIGRLKANELMMLGDAITASQAADIGLVNKVVVDEEFEEAVDDWAARLASKSPLLMKLGKDAINSTRDATLAEALEMLRAQLALALTTEDVLEGVAAFQEKRDPRWTMS
jgi:enoyl-CoA hydratase/carnithine racemase